MFRTRRVVALRFHRPTQATPGNEEVTISELHAGHDLSCPSEIIDITMKSFLRITNGGEIYLHRLDLDELHLNRWLGTRRGYFLLVSWYANCPSNAFI